MKRGRGLQFSIISFSLLFIFSTVVGGSLFEGLHSGCAAAPQSKTFFRVDSPGWAEAILTDFSFSTSFQPFISLADYIIEFIALSADVATAIMTIVLAGNGISNSSKDRMGIAILFLQLGVIFLQIAYL